MTEQPQGWRIYILRRLATDSSAQSTSCEYYRSQHFSPGSLPSGSLYDEKMGSWLALHTLKAGVSRLTSGLLLLDTCFRQHTHPQMTQVGMHSGVTPQAEHM